MAKRRIINIDGENHPSNFDSTIREVLEEAGLETPQA
jgi:hypothetical protein